jgi:hypothetical protein
VGCRVELGGVVGGEWHETWAWPDDVAGTWNDSIGRRRPRRHRRQSARAYEAPDGYRPALMSTPPSEQERKQDSMGDEQSCVFYRFTESERESAITGRVGFRSVGSRLGSVLLLLLASTPSCLIIAGHGHLPRLAGDFCFTEARLARHWRLAAGATGTHSNRRRITRLWTLPPTC